MTFEISFVFALLLITIILFITEKFPVDQVALMVMATLLVSRVISLEDSISGFSNSATVTIGAMFVISAGLFKTGALNVFGMKLSKIGRRSFWAVLFTMMLTVGLISAFVNNTAAVAIFMPIVLGVSREAKVSPSKLLMPLSFASMFGGVCTLIGTSTNILVNSIAERHGLPSLGMFEFLWAGLVFFAIGILYMMTFGNRMIPSTRAGEELTKHFEMSDYLTEIILLPKAFSIEKSLKDAPLVHDLDIEILEVFRDGRRLLLPAPDIILKEYDVLRVRANIHKIQKIQEREGIAIKSGLQWRDEDLESSQAMLVEVVIVPHSLLEGKSLEAINFRDRFSAAPLAIRRSGGIRHENLEKTRLHAGDTILIEARRDQLEHLKHYPEFVVISETEVPTFRKRKILPALAIVSAVVTFSALGIFPIVVSAIVGAIMLVLIGCLTLEEAYESIDWKVIFLLAGLLSLGIALEKSGAAVLISDVIVSGIGQWGPVALVSAFFIITTLFTNVMSNNATAALLAPIAIAAAESQGWNTRPFIMAVMFGASLSFMTPIGYQTNTLIYGPGQYKFSDFLRVGTPLNMIFWLLATWLIPTLWPF
ncbi:MAG: SLC13 family permease [Nitrospiria bacterium]